MFFTFYHAALFVGAFTFGAFIGYAVGKVTGRDETLDEIDREMRRRSGKGL